MSTSTIMILVGSIVLLVWWQLQSVSKKILVTYRRPSRQRLTKLVPLDSKTVIFDGLEFTILPDRAGLQWYKLLWGLLGNIGTWIIAYDFAWYSKYPQDPNNYWATVISPTAQRSMNNEQSFVAYNRSVDKQSGRKKGGLSEWMPYILIGAVMLIGFYYMYTLHQQDDKNIRSLMDAVRMLNK